MNRRCRQGNSEKEERGSKIEGACGREPEKKKREKRKKLKSWRYTGRDEPTDRENGQKN